MRPAFVNDPLFKKGLKIRKQVVGAEYVEHRLQTANEYTWPFEELATKTAWGMIWSRPGLPRRIRSFINLGALTALSLPHELRLHIRAALRNGLTRKEIAETLLHCAIYCGYPKSVDAMRAMREVFEQVDRENRRGAAGKRSKRR